MSEETTTTSAGDGMVTVTAKEDCNLLIDGQSVALTAGQQVEMPAETAAEYAHLGLVELSGPSAAQDTPAIPKRSPSAGAAPSKE